MLALLIASTLGQAIPVAMTPPGHFYNRSGATLNCNAVVRSSPGR